MNPQEPKAPGGNQPLDLRTVLSLYGEAMAKVGQLEKEVAQLREGVQARAVSGASPTDPTLQAALEQKERELKEKDRVIAMLRMDLSNAQAQMIRLEEKLKQAAHGNYMIYRKKRRKWWQVWRYLRPRHR